MSPGPTFDRVYLALKDQLMNGDFAPGDHLEPAVIGEDLNSSITPVRDALHRLVGERIVEAPRNDGFRVPTLTEAGLRELYGWNNALLQLALRSKARGHSIMSNHILGSDEDNRIPQIDTTAQLFRAISKRGNPEIEAAVVSLNDRLGPHRIAEKRLFANLGEELERLITEFRHDEISSLKRDLSLYHRRRQRFAPDLLLAARLRREMPETNS